MNTSFITKLQSGDISTECIECIIQSVQLNNDVNDIYMVHWDSYSLNEIEISDFDEMSKCMLDYLIQLEEYELCDMLLSKNKK